MALSRNSAGATSVRRIGTRVFSYSEKRHVLYTPFNFSMVLHVELHPLETGDSQTRDPGPGYRTQAGARGLGGGVWSGRTAK